MNQEAMLALARISKLKREISQPMLHHGYVADQRRIAAGRAKRRAEVNNVGRAIPAAGCRRRDEDVGDLALAARLGREGRAVRAMPWWTLVIPWPTPPADQARPPTACPTCGARTRPAGTQTAGSACTQRVYGPRLQLCGVHGGRGRPPAPCRGLSVAFPEVCRIP